MKKKDDLSQEKLRKLELEIEELIHKDPKSNEGDDL